MARYEMEHAKVRQQETESAQKIIMNVSGPQTQFVEPNPFAARSMDFEFENGARDLDHEHSGEKHLVSSASSAGSHDVSRANQEDGEHSKRKRRKVSLSPFSVRASDFSKGVASIMVNRALTSPSLSNSTSDMSIMSPDNKSGAGVATHAADAETPSVPLEELARMANAAASEAARNNYIHSCTNKDVLMGRGGKPRHHAGNQWYLSAKRSFQEDYGAAHTREEKTKISQQLVDAVYARGGRFLEKVAGNWYLEVDNELARKKASQALREDLKQHSDRHDQSDHSEGTTSEKHTS